MVIADFVFTATAVVLQPVTGILLVREVGYSFSDAWIFWSIVLYLVTGAFWLPRMDADADAPSRRCRRRGRNGSAALLSQVNMVVVRVGFPAFAAVIAIFWLMTARPVTG